MKVTMMMAKTKGDKISLTVMKDYKSSVFLFVFSF